MTKQAISDAFWRSWEVDDGLESYSDIHSWIIDRNNTTPVLIERISLDDCSPWHYDSKSGCIKNQNGSFFQISGLKISERDVQTGKLTVIGGQPILLQDEIGYLGIICKEFDGIMHFLMHAKIEPGNVNKVQISPTIQATRSNFLQLHGGKKPAYLEYFLRSDRHCTIVDQIQSEQSARFLGKRNRNVVILVEDDVEALPSHVWMTLGQIKRLMRCDNLVNMDTRTVLACLPWSFWPRPSFELSGDCDRAFESSILRPFDMESVNEVYRVLNDRKMFDTSDIELVPLFSLQDWEMRSDEFVHREKYPFKVVFCDISIEGREVKRWRQPLFEATGKAFFGLLVRRDEEAIRFLVKAKSEIGCFDKIELAPTCQREADSLEPMDEVERQFDDLLLGRKGVVHDVILSEEGGRFYCEQNRNVIIEVSDSFEAFESGNLPKDYFWLDYATLNLLVRANNVLNIQLRNLLSLLDIRPR